jgi:hypothetical protein
MNHQPHLHAGHILSDHPRSTARGAKRQQATTDRSKGT